MDIILLGTVASLFAGASTGIGALPVFFIKKLSKKFEDASLGFAAGVMLAASFFSLIIPGIDFGVSIYGSEELSLFIVLVGLVLGAIVIWLVEEKAPHEHFVLGGKHNPEISKDKI